jgi:hypothetical protein
MKPVYCMVFLVAISSGRADEVIKPLDEGWIPGISPRGDESQLVDFLGVRKAGTPEVWATLLKVDLAQVSMSAKVANVILNFADPEAAKGSFKLYGIAEADWDSTTLSSVNAPGWDPIKNDVDPGLVKLLSESTIVSRGPVEELVFSGSAEFDEFTAAYRGRHVTFIITKHSTRSTTLVSSRANPTLGPRIELTK